MENPELKKVDEEARQFIIRAHQIGMSVILINKLLKESDYDCNVIIIHDTLYNANIVPNPSNCSASSLTWRRFLTNILEKFESPTLEQFQIIALQDAINYYNIDKETFIGYYNEYIEFQNYFLKEIEISLNVPWILRAFFYFGFSFTGLAKKLNTKNINISTTKLYVFYREITEDLNLNDEEFKLRSVYSPPEDIKAFWKSSYRIGKSLEAIVEWTEIFTGEGFPEKSQVLEFLKGSG